MKIVILDGFTANPGDLSWEPVEKLGELTVHDWTEAEDVIPRSAGAEVIVTNKVKINADMMDKLPDLKYIGILATGYDVVDIKAAQDRGIQVSNIPVYANYSVSQLVIALMMELCYRIDRHSESVIKERKWSKSTFNSYWLNPLIGLDGKTMGIIGLGKIGERVAAVANALGMKVIAQDVFHRDVPGVRWVELEELYKEADVISIHAPLLDSTKGMINKKTLAMMKPTAFFINTSRGGLQVDQDLADALNNGVIAGAGLDVLNTEPPAIDNPVLDAKNVIITPHIGWATLDARARLIFEQAENIKAYMNGEERNLIKV